MAFHCGETVICSIEVRDADGNLADPSTSMNITITDNKNGCEVESQSMTKDSTGKYHYDWNTSADSILGIYYVVYTATDGSRISIGKDSVELTV